MESHPGIVVMLRELFGDGGRSRDAVKLATGKTLTAVTLDKGENELLLEFTDGSAIKIWDDGQSCCEYRYMHTDDDLTAFVGATFQGAAIQNGPTEEDKYGEPKESQFLIVTTSAGQFTVVNYNEHNGYYGGFALAAVIVRTALDAPHSR